MNQKSSSVTSATVLCMALWKYLLKTMQQFVTARPKALKWPIRKPRISKLKVRDIWTWSIPKTLLLLMVLVVLVVISIFLILIWWRTVDARSSDFDAGFWGSKHLTSFHILEYLPIHQSWPTPLGPSIISLPMFCFSTVPNSRIHAGRKILCGPQMPEEWLYIRPFRTMSYTIILCFLIIFFMVAFHSAF